MYVMVHDMTEDIKGLAANDALPSQVDLDFARTLNAASAVFDRFTKSEIGEDLLGPTGSLSEPISTSFETLENLPIDVDKRIAELFRVHNVQLDIEARNWNTAVRELGRAILKCEDYGTDWHSGAIPGDDTNWILLCRIMRGHLKWFQTEADIRKTGTTPVYPQHYGEILRVVHGVTDTIINPRSATAVQFKTITEAKRKRDELKKPKSIKEPKAWTLENTYALLHRWRGVHDTLTRFPESKGAIPENLWCLAPEFWGELDDADRHKLLHALATDVSRWRPRIDRLITNRVDKRTGFKDALKDAAELERIDKLTLEHLLLSEGGWLSNLIDESLAELPRNRKRQNDIASLVNGKIPQAVTAAAFRTMSAIASQTAKARPKTRRGLLLTDYYRSPEMAD